MYYKFVRCCWFTVSVRIWGSVMWRKLADAMQCRQSLERRSGLCGECQTPGAGERWKLYSVNSATPRTLICLRLASWMASLKQWKLYSIRPCLSKTSSLSRHTRARNLIGREGEHSMEHPVLLYTYTGRGGETEPLTCSPPSRRGWCHCLIWWWRRTADHTHSLHHRAAWGWRKTSPALKLLINTLLKLYTKLGLKFTCSKVNQPPSSFFSWGREGGGGGGLACETIITRRCKRHRWPRRSCHSTAHRTACPLES